MITEVDKERDEQQEWIHGGCGVSFRREPAA